MSPLHQNNMDLKRYWSRRAARLTPYTAGEQPDRKLIKLNTNENPYPPSPEVHAAIQDAEKDLRLYPPADGGAFQEAAAELHGISRDEVFCSNGSDEALALCFQAFFDPGAAVSVPDLTYSFYPVWAQMYDIRLRPVPLGSGFGIDPADYEGAAGVVLANPNAPTGVALSEPELRCIIEHASGVCIIDEAYAGFGAVSALPWIHEYDNLVVVRTLSKSYSLAGLRAGYACAAGALTAALRAVRDSFNSYPVDRLAIAGAAAALRDTEYHTETCSRIIETREKTREALLSMGLDVPESAANFLFVRFREPDAARVYTALRQRDILVRHFPAGPAPDYLRVTIGTGEQMEILIRELHAVLRHGTVETGLEAG